MEPEPDIRRNALLHAWCMASSIRNAVVLLFVSIVAILAFISSTRTLFLRSAMSEWSSAPGVQMPHDLPKYALWVQPTGKTYTEAGRTTKELSKIMETPPFSPHITLYGGSKIDSFSLDDIKTDIDALVQDVSPFNVTFSHVEANDKWWQCVYFKVDSDRSKGLCDLHDAALSTFKDEDKDPRGYYPHLSLIYGAWQSETHKKVLSEKAARLVAQWEGMPRVRPEMPKDAAAPAPDDDISWALQKGGLPLTIEVKEVVVVELTGVPSEWKIVHTAKLAGAA